MTIIDILTKAADGSVGLVAFLNSAKQRYPDLAPQADALLTMLHSAVSSENIVALASALPAEIANIARGQFDGRDHASDAI